MAKSRRSSAKRTLRSMAIVAAGVVLGIVLTKIYTGARVPRSEVLAPLPYQGRVEKALREAARTKSHVFILFWRDEDERTRSMRAAVERVVTKMAGKAIWAAVNIGDRSEEKIIDLFAARSKSLPRIVALVPRDGSVGETGLRADAVPFSSGLRQVWNRRGGSR